jgi:hypothetical protein
MPPTPPRLAPCVALLRKAASTPLQETENRRLEEEALNVLRQAIAAGFTDRDRLKNDPALAPLRSLPAFGQLLEGIPGKQPRP